MQKLTTLLTLFSLVLIIGCAKSYKNISPMGKVFPSVEGNSLSGKKWSLPSDFTQTPVVLLVGYVQDSQFDIDRWLIGLDMKDTKVMVYEIPTIEGLFPRMFQTKIDSGMRKGIPKDLWKGVITIYSGAENILAFTGNENERNARVLLLDSSHSVKYFNDEGFSVAGLNKLIKSLNQLKSSPQPKNK